MHSDGIPVVEFNRTCWGRFLVAKREQVWESRVVWWNDKRGVQQNRGGRFLAFLAALRETV